MARADLQGKPKEMEKIYRVMGRVQGIGGAALSQKESHKIK